MIEQIRTEPLRQIYLYWQSKCRDGIIPSRNDLDPPVELSGKILPFVAMIEVESNPRRYRYCLVGTAINKQYGEETTGHYVDEIDLGDMKSWVISTYDELMVTLKPSIISREFRKQSGEFIWFERLALPLSSDGKNVDMIFGGAVVEPLSPLQALRGFGGV
jgi:hypothetical protein